MKIAAQLTVDDDSLLRWFGEFSSEARSGTHAQTPDELISTYNDLSASFHADSIIAQSPLSKFLFIRNNDDALLFVDGTSYMTSLAFAIALTDNREIKAQQLVESINNEADRQVLIELYNSGCLLLQ